LHNLIYFYIFIAATVWCAWLFIHTLCGPCILCNSVYSNRSHFSITLNFFRKRLETLTAYFSFYQILKLCF